MAEVELRNCMAASVAKRLLARYLNGYPLSSTRTVDSLRLDQKENSWDVEQKIAPCRLICKGFNVVSKMPWDRESRFVCDVAFILEGS